MDHYTPKTLRPWTLVGWALNAIAYVLRHWLLFVIAALIISPIGPHLRWQYTYYDLGGGRKSMIDCVYVGSRGMVRKTFGEDCPFIAIIDARKSARISSHDIDGRPISAMLSCAGRRCSDRLHHV